MITNQSKYPPIATNYTNLKPQKLKSLNSQFLNLTTFPDSHNFRLNDISISVLCGSKDHTTLININRIRYQNKKNERQSVSSQNYDPKSTVMIRVAPEFVGN